MLWSRRYRNRQYRLQSVRDGLYGRGRISVLRMNLNRNRGRRSKSNRSFFIWRRSHGSWRRMRFRGSRFRRLNRNNIRDYNANEWRCRLRRFRRLRLPRHARRRSRRNRNRDRFGDLHRQSNCRRNLCYWRLILNRSPENWFCRVGWHIGKCRSDNNCRGGYGSIIKRSNRRRNSRCLSRCRGLSRSNGNRFDRNRFDWNRLANKFLHQIRECPRRGLRSHSRLRRNRRSHRNVCRRAGNLTIHTLLNAGATPNRKRRISIS